jgi:TetR/AcrR family transcriptional regulator, cholesterol catabolism regulator
MEPKTSVETHNRIQDQAKILFMRYGIRSVSMDDIAGGLGMSKKTIYQFFADKDELVDAIIEADIRDMRVDCDYCFTGSMNAIDEVFLTMDRMLEHLRNLNPTLLYDLQKFHFKSYRKFLQHKNSYLLEIISKNLERGKEEELYRSDIDVEILSRFRLESMMAAFNQEAFPSDKYNLADVTLVIMEHFVFGLTTLKGHKLVLQYQQERTKKKKNDDR